MSHRNVQLVIGRLVTDEELRRQFLRAPHETLAFGGSARRRVTRRP
jgi:hypothetical protein